MPFNQTGPNATAKIGTYNDVAGNQTNNSGTTNNTTTKNVGNISTGGGGAGGASHGTGAGGGAGAGGAVNLNHSSCKRKFISKIVLLPTAERVGFVVS